MGGFVAGALVGAVAGLVGLGGAEFRLPLLISVFGLAALAAVIVNKAMSLVVVSTALPARLAVQDVSTITPHLGAVATLLVGSVVGAWVGAGWATRWRTSTLYRVLAVLLALIAVLFVAERMGTLSPMGLDGVAQVVLGVPTGFGIGVVAALMGVAGGELLIPTFVLLFSVETRTAGTLSLLVSLPTMLVALLRYSRSQAFDVLGRERGFLLSMAAGSVAGSVLGGFAVGVVPERVIVPILAALLVFSAWRVWRHR